MCALKVHERSARGDLQFLNPLLEDLALRLSVSVSVSRENMFTIQKELCIDSADNTPSREHTSSTSSPTTAATLTCCGTMS